MSDSFLDTNVFVYAFETGAPAKTAIADRLINDSLSRGTGIISLIVAAALEAKCEILYTEDLQHEQRFDSLLVVNPFL